MIAFSCRNSDCAGTQVVPEAGMMKCTECSAFTSAIDVLRAYARRTGQWIIGGGTFAAVGYFRTDGILGQVLTGIGLLGLAYALFRVIRQKSLLSKVSATNSTNES